MKESTATSRTPAEEALDGVLDEIEDYLDQRQDVRDGSYGEQRPNTEMGLLSDLRWWRESAKRTRSETREKIIEECARVADEQVGPTWMRDGSAMKIADAIRALKNAAPQESRLEHVSGMAVSAEPAVAAPSAASAVADTDEPRLGIYPDRATQVNEAVELAKSFLTARWTPTYEATEMLARALLVVSSAARTPVCYGIVNAAGQMWMSEACIVEKHDGELWGELELAQEKDQTFRVVPLFAESATSFAKIGRLMRPRNGEVHFVQDVFSIPLAVHGTLDVYMSESNEEKT